MKSLKACAWMALFLVAGCSTPGPTVSPGVDTDWQADDYKYRIGAGDELGVRFPINPDLNAQVTVGPDGRGAFPLIAGVKVSGLTVEQIDATLTEAYAKVLRTPLVQTQIYNYAAGQVYIMGEVEQPGARVIRGEMTVAQAIANAGGLDPTAGTGKVIILRRRPGDGRALMRTVDVNDALRGDQAANIVLLPGDVIFVPRSRIAEVNRIVQQFITGSLPFTTNYQLNPNGRLDPLP